MKYLTLITSQVLVPSTHSVSLLYVLLAHVQAMGGLTYDTDLWHHVQKLVSGFDPIQIRYATSEFRRLLEAVADGALAAKKVSGVTLTSYMSS